MGIYEDELRSAMRNLLDAGELREVGEAADVFDALSMAFPSQDARIAWRHVPGSMQASENDHARQRGQFMQFFDEVQSRFRLSGPVTYAGDSATAFALEADIDVIRTVLPVLLEVPQHHYFMGSGCAWCMCLTFEGDMGFGPATDGRAIAR